MSTRCASTVVKLVQPHPVIAARVAGRTIMGVLLAGYRGGVASKTAVRGPQRALALHAPVSP